MLFCHTEHCDMCNYFRTSIIETSTVVRFSRSMNAHRHAVLYPLWHQKSDLQPAGCVFQSGNDAMKPSDYVFGIRNVSLQPSVGLFRFGKVALQGAGCVFRIGNIALKPSCMVFRFQNVAPQPSGLVFGFWKGEKQVGQLYFEIEMTGKQDTNHRSLF